MNIGAFDIKETAELTRGQSSSESLPVLSLDWCTRPIEPIILKLSCSADISKLKIAVGIWWPIAAFSAILIAKAVFPIDGRPATTTRSPRCKPAVFSSMMAKPVGIPVISLSDRLSVSSRSIEPETISFNCLNPWPVRWPRSAMSKTFCSARSTSSETGRPSLSCALAAISPPIWIRSLRIARCRTICAYARILAALGVAWTSCAR